MYRAIVRSTGSTGACLIAELEAAVGRDDTASRPGTVRRTEHGDGAGDFLLVCLRKIVKVSLEHAHARWIERTQQNQCRTPPPQSKDRKKTHRPPTSYLRVLHQILAIHLGTDGRKRRINRPMAHRLLELLRSTSVHICRDRTGVDSVYSRALGELAGPRARHGFERGFGAAVHALLLEAERGADAADVDDAAAAVLREVWDRGFHEEERAAHVDVVEVREVVAVALFHCEVAGDAGVVDDDVDL